MKPHFIKCADCGKEMEPMSEKHKFCSKKCRGNNWAKNNKDKVAKSIKKNYLKQKANGTAYYMTDIGKKRNLERSKKFRRLNEEELREYKKMKGREYMAKNKEIYGKTQSPEKMKAVVKCCRLPQRLRRQSIKGTGAVMSDLNNIDIKALELDIFELNQKIEKAQKELEA